MTDLRLIKALRRSGSGNHAVGFCREVVAECLSYEIAAVAYWTVFSSAHAAVLFAQADIIYSSLNLCQMPFQFPSHPLHLSVLTLNLGAPRSPKRRYNQQDDSRSQRPQEYGNIRGRKKMAERHAIDQERQSR